MNIGHASVRKYRSLATHNGFEYVDYRDKRLLWKEINPYGRHVIIETIGGNSTQIPDWKKRHAQISIYQGPDLCEMLQHREIAYKIEDLEEFMRELREGKIK